MIVKNYIQNDFIPLGLEAREDELHLLAKDFKIQHVPIVEEGMLKACWNDEDYIENTNSKPFFEDLERFCVQENQTLLETFSLFKTYETNCLPVLDAKEFYVGYITMEEVVHQFSLSPVFAENGIVLLLEKPLIDYSISQISQLIESNNSRIYTIGIHRFTQDTAQILVKLTGENIGAVVDSLERFGYRIVYKSTATTKDDFLNDRYQNLVRFLDF